MRIYAARIEAKNADVICLASSAQGRIDKIADYCRENWSSTHNIEMPGDDQPSMRIVELYFAEDQMGDHEFVVLYEPEDVE